MCSDTNCWGIPAPHARTGGVLIFAHRRVKHTDTIFYVVRQIRLHPRERSILLDIEIHGRRLHLLQWQQGCCHCSSLFSLYSHVLSLSLLYTLTLLSNNCLFYRHFMAAVLALLSTLVAAKLQLIQQWWLPTFDILDGCTCNGNNPTHRSRQMKL